MAPKVRNEPIARVETPVIPWPTVQPSAITPPMPISAAPPRVRSVSPVSEKVAKRHRPTRHVVEGEARERPARNDDEADAQPRGHVHGRSAKACVCEAVGKRGGPEQRHGKEVAGRGSESGGLAQKIAEAARL